MAGHTEHMRCGNVLRASIVAVCLPVTMSACVMAPDSKAIVPGSADRYTSAADAATPLLQSADVPKQTLSPGALPDPQWWTWFRAPALDALVNQAIAGSLTLESTQARLLGEQEALRAARASLYPQAGLAAEVAREKESSTAFGLPPGALALPPNFTLLQVGPTASYSLDLFGGIHSRVQQQAALADVQRYELGAAYLALTGNTVLQVVQLASVRAQSQAVQDLLQIDRENLDLVRKERDVGTVPDSDVVSAESELAADETLQPGLDQQMSVARHSLAILIGRNPADWSPPDIDLGALTLPSRLPLTLPSQLVHERPDILAAEAQLRAADAQVGIATAQLYPDITLSASLSGTSLNGSSLFDPAGLVWSIAAGLTQPLFDAGLRRAQRRAALAELKASASDYQQTVLRAFGQVADILHALTSDQNLVVAQKSALDLASRAVGLQRTRYQLGGTGILDLLDAERQYQQASLGYVRAQAQRYVDTIQLQIATGGASVRAITAPQDDLQHGQRSNAGASTD
jgi:NodT family efflux transporter outer membrane factor (OMF) lipoprotein